jgi:hypothetical protein
MSVRIVCIDPNAVEAYPRVIAATGQVVVCGEEVEVDDADLAAALLEQDVVWARPTTKAAKAAEKRS